MTDVGAPNVLGISTMARSGDPVPGHTSRRDQTRAGAAPAGELGSFVEHGFRMLLTSSYAWGGPELPTTAVVCMAMEMVRHLVFWLEAGEAVLVTMLERHVPPSAMIFLGSPAATSPIPMCHGRSPMSTTLRQAASAADAAAPVWRGRGSARRRPGSLRLSSSGSCSTAAKVVDERYLR